jgi:predicted TPR repeat methyltransferase
METREGYNKWSSSYDSVVNKTRDMEAMVLRKVLSTDTYNSTIELGCGTGKNTGWLAGISKNLLAVDFSEAMMNVAKQKHHLDNVVFRQADITTAWHFDKADLITASLVLEHLADISFIFSQGANTLEPQGRIYICELHPFKQLQGSRAKFESGDTMIELDYYVHHLSEYFQAAKKYGFNCVDMQEWFDDDIRTIPRLCSFVFELK